ncbi:MAG: hypothetical protein AB7T06_26670 [Kofleriaceae bacterium]
MRRLGALIVILGACAGSREVSKLRYTSTDCPDPNGCEAPLGEQAYQSPDEAHDPIADAAAQSEPPSCKSVAIALTALELGNYASEDEERAGITAKHQQACEAAKLDARETACMSTVTDVKHVGYCTRKMGAPTQRVPMMSESECKTLSNELRPSFQSYGRQNNLPAYEQACMKDGWSLELGQCMRTQAYDPIGGCRPHAPGWVFEQLEARIEKLATATK